MSANGRQRASSKPRTVHLAIYGAFTGLVILGAGGLFSLIVYGTSNPTLHALPVIVMGGLAIAAGLCADYVLAWLMHRSPDTGQARTSTHGQPGVSVPSQAPPAEPSHKEGNDGWDHDAPSSSDPDARIVPVDRQYDHANQAKGRTWDQD